MSCDLAKKNTSISDHFDDLWSRVDSFIREVNPCDVQCGTCVRKRKKQGENFCCRGCDHLGPSGCCADRPLPCRAWLCVTALRGLTAEQQNTHQALMDEISNAGFFGIRITRNQAIAKAAYRAQKSTPVRKRWDMWLFCILTFIHVQCIIISSPTRR